MVEYIPFTKRAPFTRDFSLRDVEQALYNAISSFLQRDKPFALPASQRMLITFDRSRGGDAGDDSSRRKERRAGREMA